MSDGKGGFIAGGWWKQNYDAAWEEVESEEFATRKVKFGESFQFETTANKTIQFAGSVASGEFVFTTADEKGFNYFGNPFPAKVGIQSIQTDASSGNIQFLDIAQGPAEYYKWYKTTTTPGNPNYGKAGPAKDKRDMSDGKGGFLAGGWWKQNYDAAWEEVESEEFATREVEPGEGFQFDTAASKTLTIASPYSL